MTTIGKITDEELERIRSRIGKGFEGRRPWRTEVTADAAYHLALAIGDSNPLYLNEKVARASRWGACSARRSWSTAWTPCGIPAAPACLRA